MGIHEFVMRYRWLLLPLFIIFSGLCALLSVPTVDLWLQDDNHNTLITLRNEISIGQSYDEVKDIVEKLNGDSERMWEYEEPPQIILSTPRVIFPQNAWTLVISFNEMRKVDQVGIRSMDTLYAIPKGAPKDKK